MSLKMEHKFTLFCRKHTDDSYTMRVVEIQDLSAHGVMQERCVDDLKDALRDLSKKLTPSDFEDIKQIPQGEYKKIPFVIQPTGNSGRRRRTKIRGDISTIVYPYKQQYLIIVPAVKPQLRFMADTEENIESILKQELDTYFHNDSVEDILNATVQVKEWVETINVKLLVRSPKEIVKKQNAARYKIITEVADNITSAAKRREIDRAYEVKDQVNELINVLSAQERRSILLIGETMSGKSAVINEAAYLVAQKRCPENLRKREIWKTSPEKLDSHRLFLEMLLQAIIDYSREENTIIWFEDLAEVMDSRTSFIKGDKMARFLLEPLRKGEIVIIGEITPQRFEKLISSNSAFISLFHQIRMPNYDKEKTRLITYQVRKRLELVDKVNINPDTINVIIELADRFLPYWNYPGKAVNLLKQVVKTAINMDYYNDQVTKEHVYQVFSDQSGLPKNLISDNPPLNIKNIKDFFSSRVMGQEAAVEKMIDLISSIKAGLNDPEKPMGNFIFLGPTGVGKTFLARTLAEYLFGSKERMIRLDMSEYSGSDAVYKLLGIVGSEKSSGNLTRQIIEQPFSLLLLDEIEKADQSVFDLLLQIMGEGRITAADGSTIDFRSAIIILTSNLGASNKELQNIGFGNSLMSTDMHYLQKMENFFRPEFINRIDYIVPFAHLSETSIRIITENEIQKAITRYGIIKRNITLEVEKEITELIIQEGFSPVYGARPVKRAIEKLLVNPLARYIASHKESQVQLLRLSLENGEIVINNSSVKTPRVKITETDPFKRKYTGVELPELQAKAGKLRLRSDKIIDSHPFEEMQNRLQKLIKESAKKEYLEKSDKEKKEHNNNIYKLDNLINKIRQTNTDAHYLEDLTDVVLDQKDLNYVTHIARKYNFLENQLSFLEIEFTNWNNSIGQTFFSIKKLNQHRVFKGEEDWMKIVTKMYLYWLEEKKYDYTMWELVLPSKEEEKKEIMPKFKQINYACFDDILDYIEKLNSPPLLVFEIKDSFVKGFLDGENGVHKLAVELPEETNVNHSQRLVAVKCDFAISHFAGILYCIVEDAIEFRKINPNSSWHQAFKLYVTGNEKTVRTIRKKNNKIILEDYPTTLQTTAWQQVLQGNIDPFLLKRMRDNMFNQKE